MAAADQIKSLIKSFGDGDEERFFASAMQIAASEARKGHTTFAQELKSLIEKARKNRSLSFLDRSKTIPINQSKRDLHELIEIFQPKIKLKDMILAPSVEEPLLKLVNEQQKWEVLRQHNLMPRRKLLLQGPPGCGKTMTAQAIAGELGIPVFIVRLDGLISKFMGESIAKLRLIFDAMPDHRGVYLFDEFDSIGSHRNQGQDVGEIKRVLNSFLINIEKDQSNSVIVAATNMPETLDQALFRRFDDIITYPLPNKSEIIDTIKKNLFGFKFNERINYQMLAKEAEGLNYSDIVRACEETIKEMILRGDNKLKKSELIIAIKKRKS
ncbi:Cell division protein FtsH [Fulvivirga imtechensis AK7]|uniref:Cell division protein FtsH n=1 Tax=Fulvivirga imtechensis AK7 TaxID=1237149 RepID=L8JV47_9BACT|nr:ATP-binding protein [Fulvivirga imtechensis]ELR72891.1 Cell division protein FtsH [Fulvivirga imtechensis AK7]